ncbi:hypothetical protein AVEN_4081-1 [Araneus ventricosus]|uniref:RNase H type-1 domain-containing protein n=1 Tax=Araneus ventricosus TaxID=182803 RepID=A0A4Y2IWF9_ARAVE|nr:hypothetical protein AVEN_4081-1 [Araneus ventricosus]
MSAGDPGNELADRNAKSATLEGEELSIPTPHFYIKMKICKELIRNWQCRWDNYDSESGREVRSYVPCADKRFLIYRNILIFFLTSHGPFHFYLHRFKTLNSPLCLCGRLGDADHYIFFNCPLTKEYHLKEPVVQHRVAWFKNLQENRECLSRLEMFL